MKKILIGICGIGNGHINRQLSVIRELKKKKYEVLIATEKCKIATIKQSLPEQKVIEISIPWIVCDGSGLNFAESLEKYNNIDLFRRFLEFGCQVENELGGKPDLVISDYEPNVAQYSYAAGVPLITMEQQSKFLYLDEVNLKNYSIKEEIYRLNYFFPKFSKKIISSFFPINISDKNVIQVPPIITKIVKNKTKEDLILVYLSPYSDSENYEILINIIRKIKCINFKVYSQKSDVYYEKYKSDNIEFLNFSDSFKNDLSECSALITTGGHQLISEAISIDVPLYVMPLETYEQNYNAYMVNKYNLGTNDIILSKNIMDFISKRKEFSRNIANYKKEYYQNTWQDLVIQTIDNELNNR